MDWGVVYAHPFQHAGYYPGAARVHVKLIFSRPEGRILGAQAVGTDGVEKRIDVISMAIQKHGTVYDLEECELSYARSSARRRTRSTWRAWPPRMSLEETCPWRTGTIWTREDAPSGRPRSARIRRRPRGRRHQHPARAAASAPRRACREIGKSGSIAPSGRGPTMPSGCCWQKGFQARNLSGDTSPTGDSTP